MATRRKKKPVKAPPYRVKVTNDLVARALHELGELAIPFALVLEGVDVVFTNAPLRHATTIPSDAANLQNDIVEKEHEKKRRQ